MKTLDFTERLKVFRVTEVSDGPSGARDIFHVAAQCSTDIFAFYNDHPIGGKLQSVEELLSASLLERREVE